MRPHGYIAPTAKPKDYRLGGAYQLGNGPILTDGQWTKWLPPGDVQNLAVEPEACTSFGTLNAIEILERQEYGDTTEWSDRWLAYASGTTLSGNSPDVVAHTLRNKGDVQESDWPYTRSDNTWNSFYETPPSSLNAIALQFLAKYDFGYQYIGTDSQTLMNRLNYSPLGVAGFAWALDPNNLYYSPPGTEACHWFVLVGYVENEYWLAWDSYIPNLKKLRWDYDFSLAMQYTLHTQVVKPPWYVEFLTWLYQSVGLPSPS